jgi:hypothetical protein
MLVKNNPKKAEEYIKECQKRDTVVEKKAPQEVTVAEWTNTLEELQKLYVEKTGKQLSIRYKNDVEWIRAKLAE